MEIAGKVAVITGAASGIGRAVAAELARRNVRALALVDMGEQIEQVAAIATYPLVALMSATQAMRTNLRALSETKSSKQLPLAVTGLHDFNDFIGFPRVDALQKQYMTGEQG